jgi:hypothetical protein
MISSLLLRVGTVLLLVGMVLGIAMGIEENFALAPAHAHLNLIGFVLMFLVGLYYRTMPAAGKGTLAQIQAGLHITGALVLPCGIALADLGHTPAVAIIGSLIVLTALALFALIVFRTAAAA